MQKRQATNTHANIAILQTEYKNLDSRFDDLKKDVKSLNEKLDQYACTTQKLLMEVQQENIKQHNLFEEKIQNFEKWRWMIVGAGAGVGALGYSGFQAFLM